MAGPFAADGAMPAAHRHSPMHALPRPSWRLPHPGRVPLIAVAGLVLALAVTDRAGGEPPVGCRRVPAFYEAHEAARDFFPFGLYGVAASHPVLGMPPTLAVEVNLERFSRYGVNTVLASLDMTQRQGKTELGAVGQLLYGTLLPRYEMKALPNLTTQGFRFDAEAFAGMQRDAPPLSAAETATVERKLAGKLALAADVAARHPDAILGFITDDEPHLLAPAAAAATLVERHTGVLTTFPMPTFDSAVRFSEQVQPIMANWYVCNDEWRDSWCIAARLRSIARSQPDRLFWFVPLAISFTDAHEATLPNLLDSRPLRTELRLQCWSAVATGAKGILFYNPGGWAFTWGGNEDPLFDAMGRPNAPHPRQDNLAEVGSLAADFTTIGPVLLPACPIADTRIRIDCETVRYPMFSGPAVDCGLLRDAANGRDFLIPWNNDIDRDRSGTLHPPAELVTGGRAVYDLHDLRQVELGGDGGLRVSLPPGAGRVYMLGDEASFAAVRDDILRHRVQPERVRARTLAHRLRAKAGPRPPEEPFAAADAAIARAQEAEGRRDWEAAAAAYREAADGLEALAARLPTAAVEATLDRAGGIIAAADDLMRTHDARLYDIPPLTDTVRLSDPKLPVQAEQRAWIALVKRYLELEYRLFSGDAGRGAAAAMQSAADALVRDATDQRAALWRKFSGRLEERRIPLRVALVTPDRDGIEETITYAWAYGRVEAVWIAPDARGSLCDTDGRPFVPDEYDAVWVHQLRHATPPPDAAAVDPAGSVMPALLEPATVESLREYVARGGGLLLTGIAGLYAIPLGLEREPPDRVRENGPLARDLAVGIVPAPGAERHPALAHVPPAGLLTNGGPRGQVVATECVWEKRRPTGTVLAQELDGQFGRLADVATIVEYGRGAGKVLVMGGLGCDLTPNAAGGRSNVGTRGLVRETIVDALRYLAADERHAVQDAAATDAGPAVAARSLGKRDARPETGPTWMQNARARVEISMGQSGPTAGFRYLRWDAGAGTWIPFLQQNGIDADIRDAAEMNRIRGKYNAYWAFDGVTPTRVVPAVTDDSASLSFRLERPDLWVEYRLTLVKDSPFLLVAQSDQSRPDIASSSSIVFDPPLELGVAGISADPAAVVEHRARDHRDQGWLLPITRFFAASAPADGRLCGVIPAATTPAPQVILMTPGIRQLSQVSLPTFFVGHVGPAATDAAAMQRWVNEQFAPLERFRVPPAGR